MMVYFTLFVACLFVAASAKSMERAYEHPVWVLWGEQPADESYQVRYYNSSMWASTNVTAFSENEAAEIGFGRIYRYMKGHNKRGIVMPMTIPIAVDVYQSPCVFCPSTYMVSYYIPLIYQSEPPEPSDDRVVITYYPGFVVYTRWFHTHRRSGSYTREAFELHAHLKENNVTSVATNKLVLAAYDPPFKTFLRENEVWLYYEKAKEEEEYVYVEEYVQELDENEDLIPDETIQLRY